MYTCVPSVQLMSEMLCALVISSKNRLSQFFPLLIFDSREALRDDMVQRPSLNPAILS